MYVMETEKKTYLSIYEIFLMENITTENNAMHIKKHPKIFNSIQFLKTFIFGNRA